MAHKPDATSTCPNCGFEATFNYCARCGQETHLHKETFLGLITHFVAHYFHYDSKFWKTLKMLWFHPGELTLAYRKGMRMRYIPPISLYIFISVVFFLAFFMKDRDIIKIEATNGGQISTQHISNTDSLASVLAQAVGGERNGVAIESSGLSTKENQQLLEKFLHSIPKLFFFMIPVMAFVLKLFFYRRRQLYFVDHAIFSLHFHSFWFSLFFIYAINPFEKIHEWLTAILMGIAAVYFVKALRKVYEISWLRSVFYAVIMYFAYGIVLIAAGFAQLLLLARLGT